jgi:hypothetical protein
LRALADERGVKVSVLIRKPILGWLRRVTHETTDEEAERWPRSI